MNKVHSQLLEDRFAEIYHTGSTKIFLWELLHWFGKDGGRLTKAFFRDEIIAQWQEYYENNPAPELSLIKVLADHGVTKPTAYILFNKDFLIMDGEITGDD